VRTASRPAEDLRVVRPGGTVSFHEFHRSFYWEPADILVTTHLVVQEDGTFVHSAVRVTRDRMVRYLSVPMGRCEVD